MIDTNLVCPSHHSQLWLCDACWPFLVIAFGDAFVMVGFHSTSWAFHRWTCLRGAQGMFSRQWLEWWQMVRMDAQSIGLTAENLINSWCHPWEESDACDGFDVRWVALLNAGEGWHRGHHTDPTCAYHGALRGGFDATYAVICGLEKLKLVASVQHMHRSLRHKNSKAGEAKAELSEADLKSFRSNSETTKPSSSRAATAGKKDSSKKGLLSVQNLLSALALAAAAVGAAARLGQGERGEQGEHCAVWAAAGECEQNPVYMQRVCARSCGATIHRGQALPGAPLGRVAESDLSEHCGVWAAAGECDKNPAYMLSECGRSCGD